VDGLMSTTPADTTVCQRWLEGAHSWRPISEGGFNRAEYAVAPVPEALAKSFVRTHHYSTSYPASRLRYGLYEGPELVGVAVLSIPVRKEVLTGVFPQLAPYRESLELGRFVLLNRVPANAESWFLAALFEQAADEGVRGIVSFSDPVARTNARGERLFAGHVGTIYQATNATYLGRSRPRILRLKADGSVFNDRTAAKAGTGQRGHAYAEAQLEGAGELRKLRHGGNHRYAFTLGNRRERKALARDLAAFAPLPYPKRTDEVRI